jgi:hypothetical protein
MRDPSPYAGRTVRLKATAAELGGHDVLVVDWYDRTGGGARWSETVGSDPRATGYAVRRGLAGLPDDDQVLFGRIDGMGQLIHVTEIEGEVDQARPDPRGPQAADDQAVGQPCPACRIPLAAGDMVAVLILGPGLDPAARANAAAGLPFEGVVTEVHWACATGDERYEISGEA